MSGPPPGDPDPASTAWLPPPRPGALRRLVRRAGRPRLATGPAPEPAIPPGWATGPPDFVGIGVQRAGTSLWFRLLSEHPGVSVAPGAVKEVHFFDRLALDDRGRAALAADYASRFPRAPGTLTGEWTPRYISDFWAVPLLREAAPEARLLVSLRDPVDRFASAIARARRRARERGLPVLPQDEAEAAARGLYATQLEHVYRHFPTDQVLVLQYERCVTDPQSELSRTFEFLGLGPFDPPAELIRGAVNHAGRHPRIPDDVRAALIAFLEPDLRRLEALVPELDLELWPAWTGLGG